MSDANDANQDQIPVPQDPQEPRQDAWNFDALWENYDKMIMPRGAGPKQRLEAKKAFLSGIHTVFQGVALIVDNCAADEVVKKLTELRENVEELVREIPNEEKVYEAKDNYYESPHEDWRMNLSARCAREIHQVVGNNVAPFRAVTAADILTVIRKAIERNNEYRNSQQGGQQQAG